MKIQEHLPATVRETDGELLARFASGGDQSTFSEVVARHAPMVLRLCRRMCDGDCHAAEDLAQQVFLSLAERAAVLKTRASVAGWLYRASWNVATRHRRDRATRNSHELEAAVVRAAAGSDGTASAGGGENGVPFAVVTAELHEALSRALATLPENQRDAIVLHHFAGHTVGQAAGVLGVKVGTAASWMSRGREQLRVELRRQGLFTSVEFIVLWLVGEGIAACLPNGGNEAAARTLESRVVAAGPVARTTTSVSTVAATGAAMGMSRAAAFFLITSITLGSGGVAAAAVSSGGVGGVLSSIGDAVASVVKDPKPSFVSTGGYATPGNSVSGIAASLPEPSSAAVLAAAGALSLVRRRRPALAHP